MPSEGQVTEKLDSLTLASETPAPTTAEVAAAASAEQNVTPWDVEGAVVDGVAQAIDYNKLIDQFGTRAIDDELLKRFEKLTGRKPHVFLRRGIFFSHR
jgi:tryptophanyl-tRNA synthetase